MEAPSTTPSTTVQPTRVTIPPVLRRVCLLLPWHMLYNLPQSTVAFVSGYTLEVSSILVPLRCELGGDEEQERETKYKPRPKQDKAHAMTR
ncbi:hypothetical protein D9758_017490 [Tetrapyrgos nigripes]|uniref:Uncharacterized protein n=1 Tax=Tetrapyrgos nigripes TaxID=182062 RepID=A0A8H5C349_9AGAR|nr:hypothetical protein D9758_017490 [Tetrapyrgos nigripes]